MFLPYDIKDAGSNLIIIGRGGKAKNFSAGKIEEKGFGSIEDLLDAEAGGIKELCLFSESSFS